MRPEKPPGDQLAPDVSDADLVEFSRPERAAILGIGAFGHDGSACLVDAGTGEVLFASAEERLTNVKHDWHFPIGAISRCRQEADRLSLPIVVAAVNFRAEEFISGTLAAEVRRIVPEHAAADRLNASIMAAYGTTEYIRLRGSSKSCGIILQAMADLALPYEQQRQVIERATWFFNWGIKYSLITQALRDLLPGIRISFLNHHLAHAASAFFNSGFNQATVLIIDGQGESDTVSVYLGDDQGLHELSKTRWPHSLGIFYLFATQYLGFRLGDEYKVMGMSAYGKPVYFPILRPMITVTESAEVLLRETEHLSLENMAGSGYFAFLFTDKMRQVVPRRSKEGRILQEHLDFAASVQKLTEEVGVELALQAVKLTGVDNLAIAGGVGLNGLMNNRIRTSGVCRDFFVYPASSDDGTSVGAAQVAAFCRNKYPPRRILSCYYGHEVTDDEAIRTLDEMCIEYETPDSIHQKIAQAVAQNRIVARCVGRAEYGPRALGNRSILAGARDGKMKDILNSRVKHREEFRPFAPACMREKVSEFFDLDMDAPFMLLIVSAREKAKTLLPAVVHADNSSRVQTVDAVANPDLYRILAEYEKITGLPVMINTSFNVNGETIVNSARDAIESFGFMDIDYLAIGKCWVDKEANAAILPKLGHDEYLAIRRKRFREMNYGPLADLDINLFDASFKMNPDEVARIAQENSQRS